MADTAGEAFDFVVELRGGCKSMGLPEPDKDGVQRLFSYFTELKKWNRKINLIAKRAGDREILEKHFLDSLTLVPLLQKKGTHLLDIGTGAGFPGLVCRAVLPHLRLTLVEPRLKRISFLRHVTRTLDCGDVSVLACRAEDEQALSSDDGYTHICSRAVNDISSFLDMSKRFIRPGVQIICMKGPKWKEELGVWQNGGETIGRVMLHTHTHYRLPQDSGSRHIVVFEEAEENLT